MSSIKTYRPVTLIKFGGSVVTDKSLNQHYRQKMVHQLGGELAEFRRHSADAIFIGHGQGSFAHPVVEKNAQHFTARKFFSPQKMAEMLRVVSLLHEHILDDLIACQLPTVSFRLSQQVIVNSQKEINLNLQLLESLLALETIPLSTGDIVVDTEKGNTVLSTEKIFLYLIKHLQTSPNFRVKRVVYVTDVEGVLNHDRQLIPRITAKQTIDQSMFFTESGKSDVTGAMKHKVESAQAVAALGIPVAILSPKIEHNFTNYLLEKNWIGTRIE